MLFRAPGRVNLIGEHTDYNSGFVLPVAIQLSTYARVMPKDDRGVMVSSDGFGAFQFDLDDAAPHPEKLWSDYVRGVAVALDRRFDRALRGAILEISSDIPIGAGLSSSAAIEVAGALALLSNSGVALPPLDLALLCQRAENEFVGARCGIMDQFASTHGRAGHAMLLDCRSLDVAYVRIPDHVTLVVCNTMVRHALASNEYNQRREQCEQASRVLGKSLRDATFEDLADHKLDSTIERRARHVISENQRVLDAADALRSSDVHGFGELMLQSHHSLRDDYEVSCDELDTMVSLALNLPGIYGARMTGGGFGGCTVNLVESSQAVNFVDQIAKNYQRETDIQPDIYICEASDGAGPA